MDHAAVLLHCLLDQTQTKAAAMDLAFNCASAAIKRFKNVREVSGRNSETMILYREL